MAPFPGIERINKINILTKEGNTNLDIFEKRTKIAFQCRGYIIHQFLTSHVGYNCLSLNNPINLSVF